MATAGLTQEIRRVNLDAPEWRASLLCLPAIATDAHNGEPWNYTLEGEVTDVSRQAIANAYLADEDTLLEALIAKAKMTPAQSAAPSSASEIRLCE